MAMAIHPKHGLAWTDGKGVFLVPVSVVAGQVENEHSIKLGEFDLVQSLHWSCDVTPTSCFLCVVHQQTVSLWYVEGTVPQLKIKQVRKINAVPLPKGCLWNPCRDILCILNKVQISFYFRHMEKKGSYAFPPVESGKINCGAWTQDGQKLSVAVGSTILVYKWNDIDKSINDFRVIDYTVPSIDGSISSMVAITANHVICAAELPLDSLCRTQNQSDMFAVPDLAKPNGALSSSKDGEILKPKGKPEPDLLHLQKNPKTIQDTSQLVLVSTETRSGDPLKLMGTNIEGILVPDILYFEHHRQLITVGSCAQNTLQIFTMTDKSLERVHAVSLAPDERPKGICGPVHSKTNPYGLIVMVGKQENQATDSMFLPSTPLHNCQLTLKFFALPKFERNGPATLFKELLLSTSNGNAPKQVKKLEKSVSDSRLIKTPQGGSADRLQPYAPPRRSSRKKNLISEISDSGSEDGSRRSDDGRRNSPELETEKVNFDDVPRKFTKSKSDAQFWREADGPQKQSENIEGLNSHKSVGLKGRSISMREDTRTKTPLPRRSASPDGQIQSLLLQDGRHNLESQNLSKYEPKQDLSALSTSSQSSLESREPFVKQDVPDGGLTNGGHIIQTDNLTLEAMEKELREQSNQICDLQKKISQISDLLDDTYCIPGSRYQSMEKPETVHFVLLQGAQQTKKTFLMDQGRVKLEAIIIAFDIDSVELLLDDIWVVLGANIDGYIPIKFDKNATMFITGKRATIRMRTKSESESGSIGSSTNC